MEGILKKGELVNSWIGGSVNLWISENDYW